MYEKFFGFQRAPFELVPDPDFLFLGESHDSALANLVIGIDSGKGFVAISGPIGAGKTTILRALLRRIGRNQNVCFLTQPELETDELLRAILAGFGMETQGLERTGLRRRLRQILEESEKPGILIVDEAHLLTVDALEQIRLLSNLEDDSRKLLQIVLSGQPELNELLSRPRLHPLTQRIEMFYEIEALGLEETQAYLERRIRVAGGSPNGPVFEPSALVAIHDLSGGIPRLINILADRCLITAFVDESRHVNPKVVQDAYEDLGRVTQSVMAGVRASSPNRLAELAGRSRSEVPMHAVEPTSAPEPIPMPAPRPQIVPAPVTAPAAVEPAPAPVPAPPEPVASPTPVATNVPAFAPAPENWREPYLGSTPKPSRKRPAPQQEAASRTGVDRWLAVSGIVALAVMAVLSLGSRGLPVIFASVGLDEASHPAPVQGAGLLADELDDTPGATKRTPAPPVSSPSAESPAYSIHVASFRVLSRAEDLANTLRGKVDESVRISPSESNTGLWYRVMVGMYGSRSEAIDAMTKLRDQHGFTFLRPVRMEHPESGADAIESDQ